MQVSALKAVIFRNWDLNDCAKYLGDVISDPWITSKAIEVEMSLELESDRERKKSTTASSDWRES